MFNYNKRTGNNNFLNYGSKNCILFAKKAIILQYDPAVPKQVCRFRFVDIAARCLAIGMMCKFLLTSPSFDESTNVMLVLDHQMVLADRYYGKGIGKPVPCDKVKGIYKEIFSSKGDMCKVTEPFSKKSRPAGKRLVGVMVEATGPQPACVPHVLCLLAGLFFTVLTVTHLSFLVFVR